jgi:uncharacterized protein with PIN domain
MEGDKERGRYIADRMLGRLARRLRMMGIDCAYAGQAPANEVVLRAQTERLTIITRDTRLMKRRLGLGRIFVTGDRVEEQMRCFLKQTGEDPFSAAFTRCVECNTVLEPADPGCLPESVPLYVRTRVRSFSRCPSCGRTYWSGTHRKRMALSLLRMRLAAESSCAT